MKVQVIRAGGRRHDACLVELDEGAAVADAITASGIDATGIAGVAIHGVRVEATHRVKQGDRVELLDPLLADPKDARRRRAGGQGRKV